MAANRTYPNRLESRRRFALRCRSSVRFLVALLLSVCAVIALVPSTAAQPADQLPVIKTIRELSPPKLQDLLSTEAADVTTARVYFNGQELFQVAAATAAQDRRNSPSASQRADEIERRLQDVAQRLEQAEQEPEVRWSTEDSGRQPIIYVNDRFLFTVTSLDAQLESHGSLTVRANQLERTVQEALERYLREHQPNYLWQQIQRSALIMLGLVAVHLGLRFWLQALARRRQALHEQGDQRSSTTEMSTVLRNQCLIRETKGWIDFKRALLRVAQFALWFSGIYYILGLFPQSRWLQPLLFNALRLPLRVALIALIAYWLLRLINRLIDRLFLAIQNSSALQGETSQRLGLRFSTFSQVSKSIAGFILLLIAALTGLAVLGVNVGPLLTGAGLVGLAVSLASQNLIQDFINGFLILTEDQYGVGDVIVVGDVGGLVEMMNLRITQLRNEEGRLITIPNSQISIVQNLSKEWSRVDLMIPVALDCDINQALAIVEAEAEKLRQDPTWGKLILEPPLLLGVDHLDHGGATLRIWIKTIPLKQWDVGREYRRRLMMAMEQSQIKIGIPQQIIQISGRSGAPVNGRGQPGPSLTEVG